MEFYQEPRRQLRSIRSQIDQNDDSSLEQEDQILKEVQNSKNPKIKVAICDIDGTLRGKYLHKDKFFSAVQGGMGFCNLVFGWDIGDVAYERCNFTNWGTGFPDAVAKIDLKTYRKVPWDNEVSFFLGDFDSDICPRTIMRRVKNDAEKLGYKSYFGQEFEWYNFHETPEALIERGFHAPKPMTPGMFGYSILRMAHHQSYFNEIYDLLEKFRVPIEGLHTESGPGVLEAAILYGDVLESADRAILFKTAVKEIGVKHGIMPSFMAKINEKLPGCSGHLHQSLWKDGQNLFYDPHRPHKISSLMESYMAGILYCMPHLLPMYAPTVNSYKRLVRGAWAPTTLTWGIDNRTTCIRALPLNAKSTRLELRVVGSDANPYLAHAASLASGLFGVKNKLKLSTPMTTGNGYEDKAAMELPGNLHEATEAMKRSELARDLFGTIFVDHYTQTREWEWKLFQKSVTDWELRRYFESI